MSLEFLSNASWINPQIDFLLYLQNIRIYFGDKFDTLFLNITIFGEYLIPTLISAIIYWCFDIKKGIYLLSLCALNIYIAHMFKIIACVYRPWILSSKIHPSPSAILHAGGYSFPSGHSSMAASSIGGMAFLLKNKKFLCSSLILIVFLVGLSRMFLGVHTPQDVIIGFSIGLVLVFGIYPLIDWMDKDKKRYSIFLIIFDFIFFLSLFYMFNKHYPIDYFNNKILVEPSKMLYDNIISLGFSFGLINGLMLCRRFLDINFENVSTKHKILRCVIGIVITYFLFEIVLESCFAVNLGCVVAFLKTSLVGFFITFIYPATFKALNKYINF